MDDETSLTRPQRRLLRRLFNGRVIPILVNGRALLTFREASIYLLSLTGTEREQAYTALKESPPARD